MTQDLHSSFTFHNNFFFGVCLLSTSMETGPRTTIGMTKNLTITEAFYFFLSRFIARWSIIYLLLNDGGVRPSDAFNEGSIEPAMT